MLRCHNCTRWAIALFDGMALCCANCGQEADTHSNFCYLRQPREGEVLEMIDAGRYFPIAEAQPGATDRNLRAKSTGEYRVPRAGEWFLSGAIVEAYRAQADLLHPYDIAVIVKGEYSWRENINPQN